MATRNNTDRNTAADEVAQAGEETTRAGADIARRSAETARDAVEAGLTASNEGFRRMADQITKVVGFSGPQAEELARRSSQNVRAVAEASIVLVRGAQEISRELFGLVQDGVQKSAEALNRLAGAHSVQDFIAVQSELTRDSLQQVIQGNKRVAEVSLRIAEEAARIVQAQANQNARQAHRAA